MDNKKDDESQKKIEMENQVALARGECSHQKPKTFLLLNQAPCNTQRRLAFLFASSNIPYSRVPSSPCARNTLQETVSTHPEQASASSHLQNPSVPMSHDFLALSSPDLSHVTLDESISKRIPETAPSDSNGPAQALNLEYSPSLPPISLTSTSTDLQPHLAPSYIQETASHSHEATISTVSDVNSSSSTGQTSSGSRRSSSSRSRHTYSSHRSTRSRSKRTSSHGSISSRSKETSSSRGSSLPYSRKTTSPANHGPASSYSRESYPPVSYKIPASNSGDLLYYNIQKPTSENLLKTVPFSSHRPMLALNLEHSVLLLPISLTPASPASQPQAVPSQSQETDLNSQENLTYTVSNANSSGSAEQTSSGSRKSPLSHLKQTSYSHGSTSSHLKLVSSLHESTSSHSEHISFPHDYISSYSRGRTSPTNYGPATSQSQKPYLPMSHELLASNSQDLSHFNLDSHGSTPVLSLESPAPSAPIPLSSAFSTPQPQLTTSYIQETDFNSQESTSPKLNNVNSSDSERTSSGPRESSSPCLSRTSCSNGSTYRSRGRLSPITQGLQTTSSHLQDPYLTTSNELLASNSQELLHFNLDGPSVENLVGTEASVSHGTIMTVNLDQSAPLTPMALTSAPQTQAPSYTQEADSHSREVTTSTVSNANYFGSAGQTSSVSQNFTLLPPLGIPYSATHAPASPRSMETHLSISRELSTSSSQGLSQHNLEEPVSSHLLESTPSGSLESLLPIASSSGSVPQDENRTTSDDTVRNILPSSQPGEPYPVFVRPRPVEVPRPRTAYNRSVYHPYLPLRPPRSHCLSDIYLDMDTTLFPELYM